MRNGYKQERSEPAAPAAECTVGKVGVHSQKFVSGSNLTGYSTSPCSCQVQFQITVFPRCSISFDNHAETDGILSAFQSRGIICRAVAGVMRSQGSWRWGKTKASVGPRVPAFRWRIQTNISTQKKSSDCYRFVKKRWHLITMPQQMSLSPCLIFTTALCIFGRDTCSAQLVWSMFIIKFYFSGNNEMEIL